MRLLIPTNDGINISIDFDMATSYRSLSVINGSVKDDRLISLNASSGKSSGIVENILLTADPGEERQMIVIARGISKVSEANLDDHNYKVFHSGEANIINAINQYIKDYAVNESEYCCCP